MKRFSIFLLGLIGLLQTSFLFSQNNSTALEEIKPFEEKINAYIDLAWNHTLKTNDSALIYIDLALEEAIKNKYFLGQAISLEAKGMFYEIAKGNYDLASSFYFKGIKICEEHNLTYKASLCHNLGAMFHTSDNYEKAKEYYNITYNLATEIGDSILIKKCLVNLGSVHSSLKEFNKAIDYFEKSFELKGRPDLDYTSFANLGNLYVKTKNYKKALPYLIKSVEQNDNNLDSEINLYLLINLKAITKDTLGMTGFLKRANTLLDANEISVRDQSLFLSYMADYHKSIKDYEKALYYRDRYINVYENIKERQRDNVVIEMEAKYASEKKEQEIVRQNLELELKENQKRNLKWGILSLIVGLILVVVFFKKRLSYQKQIAEQSKKIQHQKITELQHKNKLISLSSMIEGQEAERIRIAKDLHDGLGGLLSTIKAHFTSINTKTDAQEKLKIENKTTKLIDEACIAVRRISHNMIPHSLTLSGLPDVLEDLSENLLTEGYKVNLEINDFPETIDKTKQAVIYRLIQEITTNIRKHANAQNILIQLFGTNEGLSLIIEDNGVGFDYESALNKGGVGLKSINSRVQFLNGKIDWDSSKGRGSTVTIDFPKTSFLNLN